MTLQEVKQQIESKSLSDTFLIFESKESFIPTQYINAIKDILNVPVDYIENINSLNSNALDIFSMNLIKSNALRIYHCDTFEYLSNKLQDEHNLIIVCKTVEKSTATIYNNHIVKVNELEHWCIKDYLYSILTGLNTKYIDWLLDVCNYNIYRLQLEAEKLLVFNENERDIIFNQMLDDNVFSDISNHSIFDYTEAIIKKDINKFNLIYEELEAMDVEPLGTVTIFYKNFKKYLDVWYNKAPTPESTGLSSKQIYAISKLPRIWSEKQIVDILQFLSEINFKIKTGQMPMNILRDYVIVGIMERGC